MTSQKHRRSESLPSLAACLAVMWVFIPATLAAAFTGRLEWMVLFVIAAGVGGCYGKLCERRMIRHTVEQWIASVQNGPRLVP